MAVGAVPRLQDVRCPGCGRLLFRATGDGTLIEIRCACKRLVRVTDVVSPQAVADR